MSGWHASLALRYACEAQRSVARFVHNGPLRILQSLYPEGDAVCHNVLVHPPSGLVGGDTLDIQVDVAEGAHGLVTTPGATRFYRSEGLTATQQVHARIGPNARLEWLPLEGLAYNGCQALNKAVFTLAPTAQLFAWDITALGLPTAQLPFLQGRFEQHLEIQGLWLDRGCINAQDQRLLNSPLGLNGHRCMATLVLASGSPFSTATKERVAQQTLERLNAHALRPSAGLTSPNPQVMVLRVLSPLVEPAMDLLRQTWSDWRHSVWGLQGTAPRTWAL